MDTSSIVAAEARKNPSAEPVSLFLEHINKMVPGPEKEIFRQLAREQAADISPEMKAKMERLDQARQQMADAGLEEGGTHQALSQDMLKGKVEHSHVLPAEQQLTNTPDGWLTAGQKIAVLPPEMQAKIIATGLMEGIQQHRHDEHERQWGALIGSVQGAGNVAVNLAKIADFSAYCIIGDHQRASEMGHEFGTALGQTTVSGVKLFGAMQQYSYEIGYTGDYAKPVKDVVAVGDLLNHQWSELSPREQERRKYQLITEMTADGLLAAGGAQAIGKAKKFTEVLDVIAEQAGRTAGRGIEASKKAARAVGNAVDELMQPEVALPGGGKMKLRDVGRIEDNEPSDNVAAMVQYYEHGSKQPVKVSEAAQKAGVNQDKLAEMTDSALEAVRLERIEAGYRSVFYKAYPHLKGKGLEVHHALPQELLDRHPGLFKAKEIHSLEYLSGIPKDARESGERVHQLISNSWAEFLDANEHPTRAQVLKHMRELDEAYGQYFVPPLRKGAR
jgi:hypothetical protein